MTIQNLVATVGAVIPVQPGLLRNKVSDRVTSYKSSLRPEISEILSLHIGEGDHSSFY